MNLPTAAKTAFFKTKGFLSQNSPTILIAGGFISTVSAGVLAVLNTPKFMKQKEAREGLLAAVDSALAAGKTLDDKPYTAADASNDIKLINTRFALSAVKAYGPSLALIGAGGLMIGAGHNIQCKRLAQMSAAYATLSSSFKKYSDNVIERFGEKVDGDLRIGYNPDKEKAEEKPSEDKKDVEEPPKFSDIYPTSGIYSEYARIFDESNPHFKKQPVYNQVFLDSCEREANDKLRIKGYLYLNEVYEMLGYEPTEAGQIVGWMYDKHQKDGYITFNHRNTNYETSCRFMDGYHPEVILDFNVDGPITKYFRKI